MITFSDLRVESVECEDIHSIYTYKNRIIVKVVAVQPIGVPFIAPAYLIYIRLKNNRILPLYKNEFTGTGGGYWVNPTSDEIYNWLFDNWGKITERYKI